MNAPDKIYMPNELLSEEWQRHIEGQDVEYIRAEIIKDRIKQLINQSAELKEAGYGDIFYSAQISGLSLVLEIIISL